MNFLFFLQFSIQFFTRICAKFDTANQAHLKVLVSSFNLRGRRPLYLRDFIQELEKEMLQRVYA